MTFTREAAVWGLSSACSQMRLLPRNQPGLHIESKTCMEGVSPPLLGTIPGKPQVARRREMTVSFPPECDSVLTSAGHPLMPDTAVGINHGYKRFKVNIFL